MVLLEFHNKCATHESHNSLGLPPFIVDDMVAEEALKEMIERLKREKEEAERRTLNLVLSCLTMASGAILAQVISFGSNRVLSYHTVQDDDGHIRYAQRDPNTFPHRHSEGMNMTIALSRAMTQESRRIALKVSISTKIA